MSGFTAAEMSQMAHDLNVATTSLQHISKAHQLMAMNSVKQLELVQLQQSQMLDMMAAITAYFQQAKENEHQIHQENRPPAAPSGTRGAVPRRRSRAPRPGRTWCGASCVGAR